MGFLDSVGSALGLGSSGPSPRVDETGGDGELLATRRALEAGQWQAAAERMARQRNWDERAHWARELGQIRGPSKTIASWVEARPDSADAHLVAGFHLIKCGWDARGFGVGDEVGADSARRFLALLEEAEAELLRAEHLDPDDPTPAAGLLHVARGAGYEPDQARAVLERARARDPHHYVAHVHMLTYLCEKWHGSHERMFEFARSAAASAPQGSRLPVLLAVAHLERWFYSVAWGSADSPGKAAAEWALDAEELRRAARASALAPGYPLTPATVGDRNWLAAALWKARAWADADAVFRSLGPHATEMPFTWFGRRPAAAFAKARKECAARATLA